MNYQIIKQSDGTFSLYRDEILIGVYAHKSSATRKMNKLLATQEETTTSTPLGESALAVSDAPMAHATARAVEPLPTSNTGGLDKQGLISESYQTWVMDRGKPKQILLRRGVNTSAHIDTLTFTFNQAALIDSDDLIDDSEMGLLRKRELALKLSQTIYDIMGFGLTEETKGMSGFKYSYRLGTDTANYGVVAFGGIKQCSRVMVYFYGEGLAAALDGWENRLYNWIKQSAPYTRITRCDLAHDFLNGEYTPDRAYQDWLDGGYTARNTRPRARMHGYDWLDEQRTGKTFYIGTTTASRMVRVYEKGCELGDYNSNWVRLELQLRNRDYVIAHEILLKPGEYLAGAYPILADLLVERQISKVERIKKSQEISLFHCLKYAILSVAPVINFLEYLNIYDDEIIEILRGNCTTLPKRLSPDKFDSRCADVRYLHEFKCVPRNEQSFAAFITEDLEKSNFYSEYSSINYVNYEYVKGQFI